MKTRYRLMRRGSRNGAFYCVDTKTGKRTSLATTSEDEACQIIQARNQAERQPVINLQIARAYLMASDPAVTKRTWQVAMDVRFPDGFEAAFTHEMLEVLKHFKDRFGRSAGVSPASSGGVRAYASEKTGRRWWC